jgi:hypothetical protein
MATTSIRASQAPGSTTTTNYVNNGHTLRSWVAYNYDEIPEKELEVPVAQ